MQSQHWLDILSKTLKFVRQCADSICM